MFKAYNKAVHFMIVKLPKGAKVYAASGRRSSKRVLVEDLGNNRHPSPCSASEWSPSKRYPLRIWVIIDTPHPASGRRSSKGYPRRIWVIIDTPHPASGRRSSKGYPWRIWVIIDIPHPASGRRSSKGYPWRIWVIIDTPHPASGRRSSKRVPVEDLGNNRHPSPCFWTEV